MATVTGTFVDSAGNPLPASLTPEVRVIPSKPSITVGGQQVATTPKTVTPNATTGAYSFDLVPTVDAVDRGFHYLLRGSYKVPNGYGSGSGYTQVDVFEHKLHVPRGGGRIADLVDGPLAADLLAVALLTTEVAQELYDRGIRRVIDNSTTPAALYRLEA